MDWRRAGDYAFTAELDCAGWAWQFLRRCREYRNDYTWFITTWHALEADYGSPPARDFFRWKQDPRAWRAEEEIRGCASDLCPGENDQVLIECWMGAKWGFRKFPIDPVVAFPDELAWREQPITVETASAESVSALPPERIALEFDLGLPLEAQLEAARHKFALLRHGLTKTGRLPPLSVRQGAPTWHNWLRLLDALETGTNLPEIGSRLDIADPVEAARQAQAMCAHGYRRMLLLPD